MDFPNNIACASHKIDNPEETDFYYDPDHKTVYLKQAVFLIPNSLTDNRLPNRVLEALKRGTAKRCELSPEPERRDDPFLYGFAPFGGHWSASDSD